MSWVLVKICMICWMVRFPTYWLYGQTDPATQGRYDIIGFDRNVL
jgi:hypothetical protein